MISSIFDRILPEILFGTNTNVFIWFFETILPKSKEQLVALSDSRFKNEKWRDYLSNPKIQKALLHSI